MFFERFSLSQKKAFLALAQKMIEADSRIENKERLYLLYIKNEMGFETDVAIPSLSLDQITNEFKTTHSKLWMMLELIGVAHIDDEIAESEQQLVRDVAKKLNIKNNTIEELKEIVLRNKELIKKFQDIVKAHEQTTEV